MKKQTIIVHGGDTFDTYDEYIDFLRKWEIDFNDYRNGKRSWKGGLGEALGEGYEVIMPNMPNKINAKYAEWKIWFEKFVPHFDPEVILIGHSLGGTFLVKYLSENDFPKKVRAAFLVAPAYDDEHSDYSMADFRLPADVSDFMKQAGRVFLYGSIDDPVVPSIDFEKFEKAFGSATHRKFTDRGHFNQEEFPELVEDIKNLY